MLCRAGFLHVKSQITMNHTLRFLLLVRVSHTECSCFHSQPAALEELMVLNWLVKGSLYLSGGRAIYHTSLWLLFPVSPTMISLLFKLHIHHPGPHSAVKGDSGTNHITHKLKISTITCPNWLPMWRVRTQRPRPGFWETPWVLGGSTSPHWVPSRRIFRRIDGQKPRELQGTGIVIGHVSGLRRELIVRNVDEFSETKEGPPESAPRGLSHTQNNCHRRV